MKSYIKYLVLLMLIYTLTSCADEWFIEDRMYFINNTNDTLCHVSVYTYPDTLLPAENPFYNSIDYYTIFPKQTKNIQFFNSFEELFSKYIPNDTTIELIFYRKTLETYPWDTIRKNHMVLKSFFLSYDDLENKNWTITYP